MEVGLNEGTQVCWANPPGTGDAQARESKDGQVSFTTFSVAVSSRKDKTTFFPVSAFGKTGEIATKHITKGRQVLVEGRVETGEKGYFNLIADRIVFGVSPAAKEPASTKPTTKE